MKKVAIACFWERFADKHTAEEYYYVLNEAINNAHQDALRRDKWIRENNYYSSSCTATFPEDIPELGGASIFVVPFADDFELPEDPNDLTSVTNGIYTFDGKICRQMTEEEIKKSEEIPFVQSGEELFDEYLELNRYNSITEAIYKNKHLFLVYGTSFEELGRKCIKDGDEYLTANDAIEKYGFENLVDDAINANREFAISKILDYYRDFLDGADRDYKKVFDRLATGYDRDSMGFLIEKLYRDDHIRL